MGLETKALIQIIAKTENSSQPSEANWTPNWPGNERGEFADSSYSQRRPHQNGN